MKKLRRTAALWLAFSVIPVGHATGGVDPTRSDEIERLRAFAKLYGYIRFFHPSDEARQIDWDKLAIYGAGRVREPGTDVQEQLRRLFLPIAPGLQIYRSGEQPPAIDTAVLGDGPGTSVVAWQHLGVGFGNRPYASVRSNRSELVPVATTAPGRIWQSLAIQPQHRNREIRLRAAVRAEVPGAENHGHLWLHIGGGSSRGVTDMMTDRPIQTSDWQLWEILARTPADAERVIIGGYLAGAGSIWLDQFELAVRSDDGSWQQIAIADPGFENNSEGDHQSSWSRGCEGYSCEVERANAYQGTQCLRIASSMERTPSTLFEQLPAPGETIDRRLGAGLRCRWPIALPGDGERTLSEPDPRFPLARLQASLSALELEGMTTEADFRVGVVVIMWNVFQHFYPYFDVVECDWEAELERSLSAALDAGSELEFYLVLRRLTAALDDGHANVLNPALEGARAWLPVAVARAEDQVVVAASEVASLQPGDRVVSIDGVPIDDVLQREQQWISGSNQWRQYRALLTLGLGTKGSVATVGVNRRGQKLEVEVGRTAQKRIGEPQLPAIEEPREGIVYVDLTRTSSTQLQARIDDLAAADAVVFDVRGYPRCDYQILGHLIDQPVLTPVWAVPRVLYPDRERSAGYFYPERTEIAPRTPKIRGKAVFLTNARAISYAESFLGIVEHHELGEIVGQATAGANGNINPFTLPGGFVVSWTGMRVLKHDGSQHHLIGIEPTVRVQQTAAAVAAGRDEYLEAALEIIAQSSLENRAAAAVDK